MGMFDTRHHSSTATSTRCQRCGTIGTTNLACPNPRCGEKLAPNVLQAFGDPLIDAGQDIGKATIWRAQRRKAPATSGRSLLVRLRET